MKYYVYLSKNKIDMLYKQICGDRYEEENAIGFDLKIVRGETKTKSNYEENLYQRAEQVINELKWQSGKIENECKYIQCNMKLNCYYHNDFAEENKMVYWGGLQLINDTLYILYMTSSVENMLFVKKEDAEIKKFNFSSDYTCLKEFMKAYESGRVYGDDGHDYILDMTFLFIADSLNVDDKNEFLEYDFLARVFRKEYINLDHRYIDMDYCGGCIRNLFNGYNYKKICAVYASPLYISLL